MGETKQGVLTDKGDFTGHRIHLIFNKNVSFTDRTE